MKEEQILDALGAIRDTYVVEAAASGQVKRRSARWIAAVFVLLLGTVFFTQTAPGVAAAAYVREQAASLIETLFPPKEITVTVEGTSEHETYVAGGQVSAPNEAEAMPGFAIYYDPDTYEMTEENGMTYIRGIPVGPTREELRASYSALLEGLTAEEVEKTLDDLLAQQAAADASLPTCELEIRHLPDAVPTEAAADLRQEMQQHWETVSETEPYEPLSCIMFRVDSGTAWNAPVERLHFVEDGQGGTYQLTIRYFAEAEEGHGVRLTAILNTFTVIPPQ